MLAFIFGVIGLIIYLIYQAGQDLDRQQVRIHELEQKVSDLEDEKD